MLERLCQTLDSIHVDTWPLQREWISKDLSLFKNFNTGHRHRIHREYLKHRLTKDAISPAYSKMKSRATQTMAYTEKYWIYLSTQLFKLRQEHLSQEQRFKLAHFGGLCLTWLATLVGHRPKRIRPDRSVHLAPASQSERTLDKAYDGLGYLANYSIIYFMCLNILYYFTHVP
jgi:hypothetical protein